MDGVIPAAGSDLPAIVALLTQAGLPVADVTDDSHAEFLVIRNGERLAGVIGLERFGGVGLLRSLAVTPEFRGRGLGVALTRALERHARQAGLTSLVLLTETAEGFFSGRGYRIVKRTDAPAAVQTSQEFRALCPDSAICMQKDLTRA